MIPRDLTKALDLAAELQAEKDFGLHTLTSYAQQMANALHKHRAMIEESMLLDALKNASYLLDDIGTQSSVDEAARIIRAAIAKATGEGA